MGTSSFLNSVKAETIKGTEPGSIYTVIAKKDGLTLGFRPVVAPVADENLKRIVLYVGARFRVVVNSPAGALELAGQTFGLKGFKEKKAHASTFVGSRVVTLPCSAQRINEILKDTNRIGAFVETVWGIVANATEQEPLVSILQLQTYMEEEVLNSIPNAEDIVWEDLELEFGL